MTDIKLYGRVFITANIKTLTGLHIGGSNAGLEIGGVDKSVIRNPLTDQPYIPGSSLRGKMRSQTEKVQGMEQNNSISKDVKIHSCQTIGEYNANGGCPVCTVFGVPANEKISDAQPTRLLVRDVLLDEDSLKEFERMKVKSFSEIKTEVAIDRVTSAATPRTLERVPAGAVFGPAEFVFGIYEPADFDRLKTVVEALRLVEDDYIGGAGSRGSGKVRFEGIKVYARTGGDYGREIPLGDYQKVQDVLNDFGNIKAKLTQNIKAG